MQGNDDIIELLNEVLTAELTAINQYFLDARMLSNWGYERLGKRFYEESIDEMKDADVLIERILYLDGMPNLQRLGTVRVGETAPEKLRPPSTSRRRPSSGSTGASRLCTAKGDNGSRELLEGILKGEEDHADWLESQLELISQVGEAHYLAQQIRDHYPPAVRLPLSARAGEPRSSSGSCSAGWARSRSPRFLWQHRGSVLRTFDLACRLPWLLRDGQVAGCPHRGQGDPGPRRQVPTRTDLRLSGVRGRLDPSAGPCPRSSKRRATPSSRSSDVVDVRTAVVPAHLRRRVGGRRLTWPNVAATTRSMTSALPSRRLPPLGRSSGWLRRSDTPQRT